MSTIVWGVTSCILELRRKLMLPFSPTLSIDAAGSSENLLPTYQPHDIMYENTEICACILSFNNGISQRCC
jgi:hypothetical protein